MSDGNTNNSVYIQNLFTSRDNFTQGNVQEATANALSYVGQTGRIWWEPTTNAFYYSNGNTPGGVPVSVANTANITLNTATITGNLVVLGNITAAANNKIGGIAPGAGVNISNAGILTIDSANLPVSFGNFYANNNILSIVNQNQNMILDTQGNAEIQLIGNVGFYKGSNTPPTVSDRYVSFLDTGIVSIKVTAVDNAGAVNIIGSTTGNEISPGQPGTMLQITGQLSTPTRVYIDGNDNYVSLVSRRFNGNVANPTQVLAGQDVLRINSTAATDAGVGNLGMAQIRTTALENQTTTAQGSSITFTVTPIGSPASARVDVANITTANGVFATKFTTSGTISAAGNVTANNVMATTIVNTASFTGTTVSVTGNVIANNFIGNGAALTATTGANVTGTVANATSSLQLNVASSILAGNLTAAINVAKNSRTTLTYTITGLTTNHKIVVTPATPMPDSSTFFTAAWASAANTVSLQFVNSGAVNSTFYLGYFAFV